MIVRNGTSCKGNTISVSLLPCELIIWHVFSKFDAEATAMRRKSSYPEKALRMNKYIGVLIAFTFLSFASVNSFDQVVGALRSGDAEELAKHFDSRVDITLPDLNDNFSKKQAEMILKDFFEKNEVRNFTVKHKGENNGSRFCIGVLQTRSRSFRTKIFMKTKGQQEVIQEIAFQQED